MDGNSTRNGGHAGRADLAAYLAKLGLDDADLASVISLLRGSSGADGLQATPRERLLEVMQGLDLLKGIDREKLSSGAGQPEQHSAVPPRKTISLYLAEEQQILREAYQSVFSSQPGIEVLGSSGDTSTEALMAAAAALRPGVILLGVKAVQPALVEKLEMLREVCPQVGLVLLFAYYDTEGIKALRRFSRDTSAGCAYLLKHTIDTMEQLTQVVHSVAEGRIIVDPMVMEELIKTDDARSSFVHELSPKELEVLGWLAKGYRNDTIAGLLSRDVKTIERHINNIYSKLHNDKLEGPHESMHPRVRAALTYLQATGLLATLKFGEE